MKLFVVICCSITVVILISAITVILWYRKIMKRQLQHILDSINNAIDGDYIEEKFDEGINSAIDEKLNKFLTISLESKNKTIEEKNAVKSLISDISHQTKTPLSNILLYSQMLQEREDVNHEITNMAEQIQYQADKLSFLINELVQSSYLETDMISIHMKEEQIDKMIRLACQQVEMGALDKGICINYHDCGLSCEFDLKWMLEAISNILDNAIKYSPRDSHIDINVIPYEMFIRIDVKDNGMGIAEEEQGLIFKRFYRSPKVSQIKGLGIGLYLAREIISRQRGFIKVDSSLKNGSTFSIFLCC
ncbi:sensor histidine kinase [Anaeromicropila herbilytica]|uniref:histidine kinase n=1 Tax=Anaeromicropila herbilytica TaxID=2785025 RepID=A0A7R7ICS2_9FIRM|nr:HAMP domain-containing sensor histidine kinase [Anaeromicropila herbilytica]BCN29288.1 two-component sensor histidine kinase [Anaeromicropila herbilytica]